MTQCEQQSTYYVKIVDTSMKDVAQLTSTPTKKHDQLYLHQQLITFVYIKKQEAHKQNKRHKQNTHNTKDYLKAACDGIHGDSCK